MINTDLFGNELPPEPQKKKMNHSAEVAHMKLIQLHGETQGNKCKTCIHLCTRNFSKTYFKCELFNTSGNPGSDWRINWQACGKYEEDFCKGCGRKMTECICEKKSSKKRNFKIDHQAQAKKQF